MINDVWRNVVDLTVQDDPSVLPFRVLLHLFSGVFFKLARWHCFYSERWFSLRLLCCGTIREIALTVRGLMQALLGQVNDRFSHNGKQDGASEGHHTISKMSRSDQHYARGRWPLRLALGSTTASCSFPLSPHRQGASGEPHSGCK